MHISLVLNRLIPLIELIEININDISDEKYKNMLNKQIYYINGFKDKLIFNSVSN